MRRILWTVMALALSSGSLSAHHSYANYDREHPITIEGQVETIQFVNPHVVLWIRTADSTVYTAVWVGGSGAARLGVTASTLKFGDHLIVNGIPVRDPTIKELSVRQVLRPSDHSAWPASLAPRQ